MEASKEEEISSNIKELSLANRNLSSIEIEVFNDYKDVKVLDVSKNQLKSFPDLCLPNLKVLKCEDNVITDVQFLQNFPALEHLYLTGNPLNAGDRHIAVEQLPHLQNLDGKPVTEIRDVLKKVEEKLDSQVDSLRKEKYDSMMKEELSQETIIQEQKELSRELYHSLLQFSDVPVKFRRFKALSTARNVFKDAIVKSSSKECPVTTVTSPKVVRGAASPVVLLERIKIPPGVKCNEIVKCDAAGSFVKYKKVACATPKAKNIVMAKKSYRLPAHNKREHSTPELLLPGKMAKKSYRLPAHNKREHSTPELLPPGKHQKKVVFRNGHFSPKNVKSKKSGDSQSSEGHRKSKVEDLDYDPHFFLRCHGPNQDKQDDSVSVWRAAFEPDILHKGRTTDIIATCGGNKVCFINCSTGHIVQCYNDENPAENLYALAWTISATVGSKRQVCTILAAAGAGKKIHLMCPAMLKCYHRFKAHNEDINTLLFHHTQTTLLFSGGNDNFIHVWDIGQLSLPTFTTTVIKLITFKTKSNVLHLAISSTHDCLIAACCKSLLFWDFQDEENISDVVSVPAVGISIKALCKAESNGIIDGLALVADDCLAVKVSLEPTIYLLEISSLLKNKTLKRRVTPIAVLIWDTCDTPYNYLGSCKDINLTACGDNRGRIWMYDLKKLFTEVPQDTQSEEDVSSPTVVLPWPEISFEHEPLAIKEQVVINSVAFNWNATYMITCTDTNIVCIWKKS